MKLLRALVIVALFCLATICTANATIITVNFPEVNYVAGPPFPSPQITWDTETYTIPVGQMIVSANMSGTWGSTSVYYDSTAETQLFVNNVLVSDTTTLSPDPYDNVVPFSYNYTNFSSLSSGSATLSFIQTTSYEVRLSTTTLTMKTAPVPVPPSVLLLAPGLVGLAGIRRRFKK